ncbi:MAG TPA: hypothetical protein VF659_15050 [Pyrinomonadaceae bacterium]|jgi:hypothetical protein
MGKGSVLKAAALALLLGAGWAARGQGATPPGDEKLARILERAGEAVAKYQAGLFHLSFVETLRDEELGKDMTPKKSKEFVFETVVLREEVSAGEDDFYPKSLRRLKTVDGKPAKEGRRVPWYGYNVQSLALLLPKHRPRFEFTLEGEERVGGRAAYRIRVLQPGQPPPRVEWSRGMLGVGLRFHPFAPTYALLWVDAENFDVLRFESHLVEPFEFDSPRAFGPFGPSRRLRWMNQDYSVTFRRHTFKDPEQTLIVPEAAEWLTVIEGAKHPRLRATLRFNNYQRFRSDVKVVEEPE